MSEELSNERWSEIAGLHDEFDQDGRSSVVLPMRISGIDGSQLKASPKAVSFAEGLAFDAHWSGISDARRKHGQDLAA